MTESIREIYWNIGESFGSLSVYLTAIVALAVMTWGVLRDIGRWRRGKPDARIANLGARMIEALSQVFGQKRVLRDRKPGSANVAWPATVVLRSTRILRVIQRIVPAIPAPLFWVGDGLRH